MTSSGIRVANAPVSWGSPRNRRVQPKPLPYDVVLDEIAETGYAAPSSGIGASCRLTQPSSAMSSRGGAGADRRLRAGADCAIPARWRLVSSTLCASPAGRGRPGG